MDRKYLVECSHLCHDFINPWKVELVEPYMGKVAETFRFSTEEEVYVKVREYHEKYRNRLTISEHVYAVAPMLDFREILDEHRGE